MLPKKADRETVQPRKQAHPSRSPRVRFSWTLCRPYPRHGHLRAHPKQRCSRARHNPDLDLQVQEQPTAPTGHGASLEHGQREFRLALPSEQVRAVWHLDCVLAVGCEHGVDGAVLDGR